MAITLTILILYVIVMLIVTSYAQKKTAKGNSNSFLFATDSVPWLMVGTMILCTNVGSGTTVGIAENSYGHGISSAWYAVALAVQVIFFGIVMSRMTKRYNVPTASGMIVQLFSKFDGIVCGIALIILQVGILCLQILAAGSVLASILPFGNAWCMVISAAVFFIIVMIGGYMGATLTNVINAFVIYIGLIIGLFVALFVHSNGSFAELFSSLESTAPEVAWTDPVMGMGVSTVVSWVLVQLFCAPSVQSLFSTTSSAKDTKAATKGFIFGGIFTIPIGIICALIGMIGAKAFPGLETSAMALPMVIASLPPVISGIILAGLWAAIVSTATGVIMGMSGTVTRDLYVKYMRPKASETDKIRLGRVILVLDIVIATLIALRASGIVSIFMLINLLIVPYGILLVFIFYAPKFLRRSSCTFTMAGGVIGLILWYCVPAIQPVFLQQNAYLAIPLALIAIVISHFVDKRPLDVSSMKAMERPKNN